jgi:hypothetical protein
MTRLCTGQPRNRRSILVQEQDICFVSKASRLVLGASQPPVQCVPLALPRASPWSSPSFSSEVKPAWSYTSTHSHVFMVRMERRLNLLSAAYDSWTGSPSKTHSCLTGQWDRKTSTAVLCDQPLLRYFITFVSYWCQLKPFKMKPVVVLSVWAIIQNFTKIRLTVLWIKRVHFTTNAAHKPICSSLSVRIWIVTSKQSGEQYLFIRKSIKQAVYLFFVWFRFYSRHSE